MRVTVTSFILDSSIVISASQVRKYVQRGDQVRSLAKDAALEK